MSWPDASSRTISVRRRLVRVRIGHLRDFINSTFGHTAVISFNRSPSVTKTYATINAVTVAATRIAPTISTALLNKTPENRVGSLDV